MSESVTGLCKVGVVSLGCDKNTVDTEKMLYRLTEGGCEIVTDPTAADVIIINTCAFIEKARQEAIDTIFEYADYGKKLIITGCLPQKYVDEMFDELVEVDGFLGIDNYDKIVEAVRSVLRGNRVNLVTSGERPAYKPARVLSTPKHYAYLKIADGCYNNCTFCTIPSIRGRYRSVSIEDLVEEAEALSDSGVKELILVAQDVTAYGIDLYGSYKLVELLKRLTEINGLVWVRLLYCYADKISDELIEEIAQNAKICKYIDIPLQHISDSVLKQMGRRYTYQDIVALLKKLRQRIPNISIRSTFMVGFPNETEGDFKKLCNFIKENTIENAGFFEYSAEDGTPAAKLEQIAQPIKRKRFEKIQKINQNICLERQSKTCDKTLQCMVDYYDEDACFYVCRSEGNAPNIDTNVFVDVPPSQIGLDLGKIIKVKITQSDGYDLVGTLVN